MNKIFTYILFLLISHAGLSQKVMTFSDAEKNGIRISNLDSIYLSAVHSDSTKSVFHRNQEEFIQSYQKMLQELGTFLKQNNFKWGKQTRCFNRIYFNKNGKVDYFVYKFSQGELTEEKEKQFQDLLLQFLQSYSFPLKSSSGFAQCSPVRYND